MGRGEKYVDLLTKVRTYVLIIPMNIYYGFGDYMVFKVSQFPAVQIKAGCFTIVFR